MRSINAMSHISKKTAIKILYWNAIAAVLVLTLGVTGLIRQVHRLDGLVVKIAQKHHLNPRLVSSVIWKESRYNTTAVGSAGEIGLMQIMPATGGEWAKSTHYTPFDKTMLFKPEVNIEAGSWYLAKALRDWREQQDPLLYALAQYNAGRSRVLAWSRGKDEAPSEFMSRITIDSTKKYIQDIVKRYRGKVPE